MSGFESVIPVGVKNNFPLKINNTKIENLGPGSGCRLPMSGDVLFH